MDALFPGRILEHCRLSGYNFACALLKSEGGRGSYLINEELSGESH